MDKSEIVFLSSSKSEPRVKFSDSSAPPTVGSTSKGNAGSGILQERPKPKIAHITPTPQIEHGYLSSPTPSLTPNTSHHQQMSSSTTPRIPLAELDSTQLSQRLFHSPNPNVSHHTNQSQMSPSMSFCQQQSSSGSPSHLLHTQVPHTGAGARSSTRDRRHQLHTERQLVELKQQVEHLGNMMAARHLDQGGGGGSISVYQQRVEQLESEREELEQMVEERDQRLESMRNSVSALNAEYMSDLASVREECKELASSVQIKEDEVSKLELDYQKSLKTIKALKSYIETLPAEEEVRDLKSRCEARTNQLTESELKLVESEEEIKNLRNELRSANKEILKLEINNKEVLEQNKEMSLRIKEEEKRRMASRNLDENQVELLVFDKEELKIENNKLKNLLDWKSKKFEDEKNKLEEQVRNLGSLLEKTNKQIQVNSTQVRESNVAKSLLDSELQKKNEMINSLSAKLDRLGAESRSLRSSSESTSQLDGHYTRLTRCMGKCVSELNSLTELCHQVVSGANPNMSVLLGTRDILSPVSSLDRDMASLNTQEKLELVQEQMKEMRQVQVEIKELRSKIADKYTDRLADDMHNMTGCVAQ